MVGHNALLTVRAQIQFAAQGRGRWGRLISPRLAIARGIQAGRHMRGLPCASIAYMSLVTAQEETFWVIENAHRRSNSSTRRPLAHTRNPQSRLGQWRLARTQSNTSRIPRVVLLELTPSRTLCNGLGQLPLVFAGTGLPLVMEVELGSPHWPLDCALGNLAGAPRCCTPYPCGL